MKVTNLRPLYRLSEAVCDATKKPVSEIKKCCVAFTSRRGLKYRRRTRAPSLGWHVDDFANRRWGNVAVLARRSGFARRQN